MRHSMDMSEIMAQTTAVVKKWGKVVGVELSKEVLQKEKIKPNDTVVISVKKADPIMALFGTWKTKKSTQQIRDELRKGWM